MGKWYKYLVSLHTRMASCSFRILNKEAQTRVTHFIQLIFCPLFASALRADGNSVRDVHHLKLSANFFIKNRILPVICLCTGFFFFTLRNPGSAVEQGRCRCFPLPAAGWVPGLFSLPFLKRCKTGPVFPDLECFVFLHSPLSLRYP